MPPIQRLLALGITLLAAVVVLLGAYTRLTGSGLGCPDWPGCYGQLSVPVGLPEASKAWTEMIHRYAAGSLVLLVTLQAGLSWRRHGWRQPAALALLALVSLQALLGMWTVTFKVWPQVVTLHLLGGLGTLCLAYLHWRRLARGTRLAPGTAGPRRLARLGLLAFALQVALGGWTSTNHAGAVCPALPGCGSVSWQALDFSEGLQVAQPVGPSYLAGSLSLNARAALHMAHRLGALVLLGVLAVLAWRLYRRGLRRHASVLALGGFGQALLGMASAVWATPLPLALAHTGGAALLALVLVEVNHRLTLAPRAASRGAALARWQPRPLLLRNAP
ncbi:COX15/CtaA family protein [Pseudomonas sp. RIT-PI-S]|uniref:COX15/CtaA family protein n=1 Tax=Pseudomonas sp. RIT-PI-S TaxID=3035295 RepID=UPI0021D9A037|nr:COX15/CtaA family protein [Pseudomonas sp. RIT-PI-S]